MFGMWDAIYAYLSRMVGNRTDAADSAGSLHAKTTDIKNAVSNVQTTLTAKSAIKSIQRGTAAAGAATPFSVTISSVNTSKTMVNLLGKHWNNTNTLTEANAFVSLYLTDSTTLTINSYVAGHTISWEVIEYV
jgi:hypothetical protein